MLAKIRTLGRALLTMGPGRTQNFLGARWVPWLLARTPESRRRAVALRLLSLSPHYFRSDRLWPDSATLEHEADRNRRSRQQIVEEVLRPHAGSAQVVLDYGCGPGFMARALAPHVREVVACDISPGALACARVLNPAPNLEYCNVADPAWSRPWQGRFDLAYSFAVAQHMPDSALAEVLDVVRELLRPGARALIHVVVDGQGWRTESDWVSDHSLQGRLRLKYALQCFSRTTAQVLRLAGDAGFADAELLPLAELTSVDDDIRGQHLLLARRPA